MSRLVSYFSLTLLFTLSACFVDYAFVVVISTTTTAADALSVTTVVYPATAHGLRKGDEHPAYTLLVTYGTPLPFTVSTPNTHRQTRRPRNVPHQQ